MRRIVVKYNENSWVIDGNGVASAASPLDEPMYVEVRKICNRFNICLHYMPTSEKYRIIKSESVCIKYGVISGKVLEFIELTENNTIPVLVNIFESIKQNNAMRVMMNIKFAESLLRKIIVECNMQK